MKIKTVITNSQGLEAKLNEIGWENILQILPESQELEAKLNEIGWEHILQILSDHRYDGTLFVIIYKEREHGTT